MTDYISGVKSTVDRYGANVANAYGNGIGVVDVTSQVNVEELLQSDTSLVLIEFGTLRESPRKPFWDVSFAIGVKMTKDASNYKQMDVLKVISDMIEVDATLPVYDYSGAVAGAQLGYLVVTSVDVDQAQSDRMMGLRMVLITAKGLSY